MFSGISTFGRLPYFPCLASNEEKYDIAFIGKSTALRDLQWLSRSREGHGRWLTESISKVLPSIPAPLTGLEHDSAQVVFGKVAVVSIYSTSLVQNHAYSCLALSEGSRKVRFSGGYNVPLDANPFHSWATVLDCGDIPVTS